MMFNNNQDLRSFAFKLCAELEHKGEYEPANELKLWNKEAFTSSSEFLGELMLILEKVKETSKLPDMKQKIEQSLTVIKKAMD